LDYDWRFTPEAVALLLQESQRLNPDNTPLALLGMPSVYQAAIADPNRPAILLDATRTTIAALRHDGLSPGQKHQVAAQCDLTRDALPAIHAGVVLLDPPWYEDHMRAFLWAATALCRIGGHILVSFPRQAPDPASRTTG